MSAQSPAYVYVGPKAMSPELRLVVIIIAAAAVAVTGMFHVIAYVDVGLIPWGIEGALCLGLPLVPAMVFDRHRVTREWRPPLPFRGVVAGAPSYISLPRWALWTVRVLFGYFAVLFIVSVVTSGRDRLRCVDLGGTYFLVQGTITQNVSWAACQAARAPFFRWWSGLLFVGTLMLALNWTVRRPPPSTPRS